MDLQDNFSNTEPFDRHTTNQRKEALFINNAKSPALGKNVLKLFSGKKNQKGILKNIYAVGGKAEAKLKTSAAPYLKGNKLTIILAADIPSHGFRKIKQKDLEPTITVFFDFKHNHYDGIKFDLSPFGKHQAQECWGVEGVLSSDTERKLGKRIRKGWKAHDKKIGQKWLIKLELELNKFGIENIAESPVIGLCIQRRQEHFYHFEESCWPNCRVWQPVPTVYGDLYLTDNDFQIKHFNFGEPIHGYNEAKVAAENHSKQTKEVEIITSTNAPHFKKQLSVTRKLQAGKSNSITVPYETGVLDYRDQIVSFDFIIDNKKVYSSSYLAGSCYGFAFGSSYLQIRHKLPKNEKRIQPDPDPKDKDFVFKKRLYILSNMPEFMRDKKDPSNIILGKTGSKTVVKFDLSKKGIMRRIGKFIESLFDNDDDRLIAANFFIHQVNTWSGTFSRFSSCATPATILRTQYILCGQFATALAGLLANMIEIKTGKPFTAHYGCASNHVICAVSRGKDHVILDPNLGYFYPATNNKRLATNKELYHNLELVKRSNPGRLKDYKISEARMCFSVYMNNHPAEFAAE
ncbi:MAG: hypothetical protein ACYTFY_14980 [Planctomycetota bacterium]|jgi:hypothetical protein